MKRGEIYRVRKPSSADPRRSRFFVVVSRQALIDSRFSTVICAPVYSAHDGLSTQVAVGVEQGMAHESSIHCDELMSLPRAKLTDYVATLGKDKLSELARALARALEIEQARSGLV